jgi:stage II sporulation protein D
MFLFQLTTLIFFFLFPCAAQENDLMICKIRVLLAKLTEESASFSVQSPDGFIVTCLTVPDCESEFDEQELIVSSEKKGLFVNKRLVKDRAIKITPRDGYLNFGGNEFYGDFILIQQGSDFFFINHVDLEKYVACVLRCESWPGWPLEVNKAFAITCRTYAVHKVVEAHKKEKKPLYDIRATNAHQTYKGKHTHSTIYQAIDETNGIIMTWNKVPIDAMYDSCCGGVVPSKIKNFPPKHAPYLARSYACSYCNTCFLYAWKTSYSTQELGELLSKKLGRKTIVRDVVIEKKDAAGLPQVIAFKTPREWVKLSGKEMYSLCKNIKSMAYTITKKGQHFIIEGKGFGHNRGLCQWGARRMIKEGWQCEEVLRFYYPGIEFKKMELKHASV